MIYFCKHGVNKLHTHTTKCARRIIENRRNRWNMSKISKGQETQSSILRAARELFYAQGYANTTTRQITRLSNVNLGLINYYFQSKGAIALLIYRDIRDGFDDVLRRSGYDGPSAKSHLMSVAADMLATLKNRCYAMFFLDIAETPEVRVYVQEHILAALRTYLPEKADEEIYLLTCASISALKPALIRAYYEHLGSVSIQALMRYYLDRYLWFFKEDPSLCDELLAELGLYYIDVVDNFTPVFTKLSPNPSVPRG